MPAVQPFPFAFTGAMRWLTLAVVAWTLPACFSDRPAEPAADTAAGAGADQQTTVADTATAANADPDLSAPVDTAPAAGDADAAADASAPADVPADAAAPDAAPDALPAADAIQPDAAPTCPPGGAKPETCNAQDDDCDGQTDEDAAASCAAGPPCTKAVCFQGVCGALADLPATAACSDGNACTTGDVCAKGVCAGSAIPCDDSKPCTTDGCAPLSGCTHEDNNGAACDDGNLCTNDACQAAACAHLPNAATCSDGDACTAGEACVGGSCKGAKPLLCDDKNPCTADACDSATGKCAGVPTADACNDGDACTNGDACAAGACAGKQIACSDGNACTDDGCAKATGCTFQANSIVCDDGNACTASDACGKGWCAGGAKVCSDGNPCTDDGCDPAKGCTFANNAVPCSDGNVCTSDDGCKAGTCAGGGALPCVDGNPCTQDGCDKAKGCVFAPAAGACSDGDGCTSGDACQAGVCQAGKGAGCDDGNACSVDGCDKGSGCINSPDSGTKCPDDGLPCTTDTCNAGNCKHSIAAGCVIAGVCAAAGANPANACEACTSGNTTWTKLDDAACEDSNKCTAGDKCLQGKCGGGTAVACDDGNACTVDACDATKGCTYAAKAKCCGNGVAEAGEECDGGGVPTVACGKTCKAVAVPLGFAAPDQGTVESVAFGSGLVALAWRGWSGSGDGIDYGIWLALVGVDGSLRRGPVKVNQTAIDSRFVPYDRGAIGLGVVGGKVAVYWGEPGWYGGTGSTTIHKLNARVYDGLLAPADWATTIAPSYYPGGNLGVVPRLDGSGWFACWQGQTFDGNGSSSKKIPGCAMLPVSAPTTPKPIEVSSILAPTDEPLAVAVAPQSPSGYFLLLSRKTQAGLREVVLQRLGAEGALQGSPVVLHSTQNGGYFVGAAATDIAGRLAWVKGKDIKIVEGGLVIASLTPDPSASKIDDIRPRSDGGWTVATSQSWDSTVPANGADVRNLHIGADLKATTP
ncbi:MAG: hypothetical protein EXR79_17685, partial [Myxococcales bacterium]|nr:hypothetical protein [Myxococcales bacterium]